MEERDSLLVQWTDLLSYKKMVDKAETFLSNEDF